MVSRESAFPRDSSASNLSQRHAPAINVGLAERWASLVGGGLLALYGLGRRSLGGLALGAAGGALVYRGVTGHCNVYHALGVNTAAAKEPSADLTLPAAKREEDIVLEHSVIVDRPAAELWRFWRNVENLRQFISTIESVNPIDQRRSHWVARLPDGSRLEWDAEIINELENSFIAWLSVSGNFDVSGSVNFLPISEGRSTDVRVIVRIGVPPNRAGAFIAFDPARHVQEDLLRFKQLMESTAVRPPMA